jgi:hypothetical protein
VRLGLVLIHTQLPPPLGYNFRIKNMIYIEQNATNNIFVNVSQYKTGDFGANPRYLWRLQNAQGRNIVSFYPENATSTYPSMYANRYDVFSFDTFKNLPQNFNYTGGSPCNIWLENENQYWLGVYEMPSGSTSYNPSSAKLLNSLAFVFVPVENEFYTGNTANFEPNKIYYKNGNGITPTPSITSSPTPTPSITPTNTSSPTPTPTITPSPSPQEVLWVAGNNSSSLIYSTDNTNWTLMPNNPGIGNYSVIKEDGRWYIAGRSGSTTDYVMLKTSTTGYDNWTANTNIETNVFSGSNNGSIYSLIKGGNLYLAGGSGNNMTNKLAYSYDGLSWSAQTLSGFNSLGAIQKLYYDGSNYWLLYNTLQPYNLLKSTDGFNWSGITGITALTQTGLTNIVSNRNGKLLAISQLTTSLNLNTRIVISEDNGITWSPSTNAGSIFTSGSTFGNGAGLQFNGNVYVAGITTGAGNNAYGYSYDGYNWSAITALSAFRYNFDLKWDGTMFQALGSFPGTDKHIGYSYDGINWNISTYPTFTTGALWLNEIGSKNGEVLPSSTPTPTPTITPS